MKTDSRTGILNIVRLAITVAALLMILFGISHGEAAVVLQKAAKVCLECIGLG